MTDGDGIEGLEEELAAFERAAGGASAMMGALQEGMREVEAGARSAGVEVASLSRGLKRGFEGVVFEGRKLSDALEGVVRGVMRQAYGAAVTPVASGLGGAIGGAMERLLPFADGAAFTQGRVVPFARGGVVSGPVTFPMRGATGLMGEAGPEAIMPLSRDASGKLGVRSDGAAMAPRVVVNISTPDVEGFRRSQTQVAAQVGRALSRAARNR